MSSRAIVVNPIMTFPTRQSESKEPLIDPDEGEQPVNLLDLKHPDALPVMDALLAQALK